MLPNLSATSCGNVPALGAPHAGLLPIFFLVGILAIWWSAGMMAAAWRKSHRPPGTAGVWTAMAVSSLGDWVLVGATPKGTLTDAEFKQATWDVVNLDAAATTGPGSAQPGRMTPASPTPQRPPPSRWKGSWLEVRARCLNQGH